MTSKEARERTINDYKQDLSLFYRIYSGEKRKQHPDMHRLKETRKILCFKGIHYLSYTRNNEDEHNKALDFVNSLEGLLDIINNSDSLFCSNFTKTRKK